MPSQGRSSSLSADPVSCKAGIAVATRSAPPGLRVLQIIGPFMSLLPSGLAGVEILGREMGGGRGEIG